MTFVVNNFMLTKSTTWNSYIVLHKTIIGKLIATKTLDKNKLAKKLLSQKIENY